MNTALFCGTLCAAFAAAALPAAGAPSIVPKPVSLEVERGAFVLDGDTVVLFAEAPSGAEAEARYLASVLRPATGFALPVRGLDAGAGARNAIVLGLGDTGGGLGEEGYRLEVEGDSVRLTAPAAAGLFYGVQTLRQLLPAEIMSRVKCEGVAWTVPCVVIEDRPRFAWRGLCVDVARHFMPKEFLLEFIDVLALHKMNSLHLHLTDDQGWRVEIKKYPKLTEVGAWRAETIVGHGGKSRSFDGTRHGGFYTQEEIREIVAHAAARHINIVPEIEMPGHAQAAIAGYPELGNTGETLAVLTKWGVNPYIFNAEESTILFLQDVLEEVLDLFPSPYIHVGGDEAVKEQWEKSPAAQARIKELGLADEHALQSYFIGRMDAFLTEKGRRLVGWDEILEGGLAEGATVMSWRGTKGGIAAAKAGHDVVMAPTSHTYLDYYQGDPKTEPLAIGGNLPLEQVYGFNPIPKTLTRAEAERVLGAQGQLWSEYIATPEHLEYMAFPRACALAEVVWTPQDARAYDDFRARLEKHVERLERLGVNFRSLDP